jgi:hypothetical protein
MSYKGFTAGKSYADLTSITQPHPHIDEVPEFKQVSEEMVAWFWHSKRSYFPGYQPQPAPAPWYPNGLRVDYHFEYAFSPQTSAGPSSAVGVEDLKINAARIVTGNIEVYRSILHFARQ